VKISRSYLKQIILEELQKEVMKVSALQRQYEKERSSKSPKILDLMREVASLGHEGVISFLNVLDTHLKNIKITAKDLMAISENEAFMGPMVYSKVLVASKDGVEMMRSKAFQTEEELAQLEALVATLEAQGFDVEVVRADTDDETAVSVQDEPEMKAY